MSKLDQLHTIKRLGVPTPRFVGISYEDFCAGRHHRLTVHLSFPISVRSSFSQEDGVKRSMAGHFLTRLNVKRNELDEAIEAVFASYPHRHGQYLIAQEMVEVQASGVLFAYRKAVWKMNYFEGMGEQVVGGEVNPLTILLPRFQYKDIFWSGITMPWKPFPKDHPHRAFARSFIKLSAYTQKLLKSQPLESPLGLDIEFTIHNHEVYVLQARPITNEEEAEEVLTSANHKEILPPHPSPLMTAIIDSCSTHLFAYYRKLDPTLPNRDFIQISAGMPWINLSALLDTMVEWGLPTALVCESVGAEDPYRVGLRPWQALGKFKVFMAVLKEQLSVIGRTRRWVRDKQRYLLRVIETRRLLWRNNPDIAFNNWMTDMQVVYVELVSLMQALTGAMSGPIKVLARRGRLDHLSVQSESGQFLQAFQDVAHGKVEKEVFLKNYGHRGFYESDIGQARFSEYTEAQWTQLMESMQQGGSGKNEGKPRQKISWYSRPFVQLMNTREWLRHHAMRYFFLLREEIQAHAENRMGKELDFASFYPEDLSQVLDGSIDATTLAQIHYPESAGWDMDAFLRNQHDRRLPLSILETLQGQDEEVHPQGIGIYPGKVKGQVWRVPKSDLATLKRPDYENIILVADSLDPGWIPYFLQVQGVLSYVGGILSHASIILRESGIPSVTRIPPQLILEEGEWIEIDGKTGEVTRLPESQEQIPYA
ncbi:MAG: PEP/pyruvate-binding domain-containing protein [Bacteroidota bacterium]